MKRAIPLLITAVGGFVLLVSFFIPAIHDLGDFVAISFDILASIAFVLGGGNLLKVHLKKISDRVHGWGYSAVTIVAFLAMLTAGLTKWGAAPAPNQEFYGETFAELPLEAFPDAEIAVVPGEIPERGDGEKLPLSVRRQLTQTSTPAGEPQLVFRGWMSQDQLADLKDYEDESAWLESVQQLHEAAQPPDDLKDVLSYRADHEALGYAGYMSEAHRDAIAALGDDPVWRQAVEDIYERSRRTTRVRYDELPARFEIPEAQQDVVSVDRDARELIMNGPMSVSLRNDLASAFAHFPVARPMNVEQRADFLSEIESRGRPLTDRERAAFEKVLEGSWSVEQVAEALQAIGAQAALSEAQLAAVRGFADAPEMTVDELLTRIGEAAPLTDGQRSALQTFFDQVPTLAERNRAVWLAIEEAEPELRLTPEQRQFLLAANRLQERWQATVQQLFAAAHVPKYPWSGAYRDQGNPFWWMYEFLFKPLTATMFAMLAFYVASAAFRAFRAKNLEAILLLGTAFIILLGRTFAGVYLTAWVPEEVSFFRIENLSMYVMQVFNTAGNRAIMIGIALGIASTSLRVLLGVDRSYLGSRE